ncbi:hypothetical protein Cgig2_031380 [Carnegiea gigantea]|uniref:Uncharacterized protein n=1 Tax=Carnegiea gigantea TaxID=171969 RepID=A0A9Q1JPG1_9CARY|nr:hypothetical protein Cgig2_031380 [Carnegiea gigantea]
MENGLGVKKTVEKNESRRVECLEVIHRRRKQKFEGNASLDDKGETRWTIGDMMMKRSTYLSRGRGGSGDGRQQRKEYSYGVTLASPYLMGKGDIVYSCEEVDPCTSKVLGSTEEGISDKGKAYLVFFFLFDVALMTRLPAIKRRLEFDGEEEVSTNLKKMVTSDGYNNICEESQWKCDKGGRTSALWNYIHKMINLWIGCSFHAYHMEQPGLRSVT